jgi:DNA helicase-2/ATP-dependent DNA helicase PcrA
MRFIADLHIHSHFSRATSKDLVPEELSFWAQKKGIVVIGTGDFTHPGWLAELQEKLVEAENGLYRLRPELEKEVEARVPESCRAETRYVLSGEISCIYKRSGRTRKVHNLILMPDFDTVRTFNERLSRIGNLRSDGRPILGLDSHDLLDIALETSERTFFIPAHIWTPWFSLFGSKSGFDKIEECFGDLTSHIHALETGLSSDPPMNRHLSALDPYLLVSNSDAHSSAKLGREANLFDVELGYDQILEAMISQKGFLGTIEFFPEEGKYHLDGHRKCRIKLHPTETQKQNGLCPRCGKPITVGVLHRVYELSDRDTPRFSLPFHSLIPLPEILSEILDCGPSTKKVSVAYEDILAAMGPEIGILMDTPLEEIGRGGGPLLEEAIQRMRHNKVIREEGYDGEYGVIRLFDESEKRTFYGQTNLFKPPENRSRVSEPQPFFEKKPKKETENKEPFHPHLFDPILSPLNDEQKEAVLFQGPHLLIVAGPGTGKTLTLTHRIAYHIRSGYIRPEEVLALTFTNKAAREMKKRLTALTPESAVYVATFHAFCRDVVRENHETLGLPSDFGICSEADAFSLAEQVLAESGKGSRTASRFLKNLRSLKQESPAGGADEDSGGLRALFRSYQKRLRDLGLLDLDDLEVETLRLFKEYPETTLPYSERFRQIFVDEYQDTNPSQVEILRLLVYRKVSSPRAVPDGPCDVRLSAIGDPDQAIYGFRGADVDNFYRFLHDFPGSRETVLSLNYRSTQNILDAAAALMEKKKPLKATTGRGPLISLSTCRSDAEEAEMVVEQIEKLMGGTSYFALDTGRVASHEEGDNLGFGDLAVLFRLNSQGDAFEEAFSRAGIPYVRSGEKPLISQYPVDVLWRYLQTCLYPGNAYYLDAYRRLIDRSHLGYQPCLAYSPCSPTASPPSSLSSDKPAPISGTGEDLPSGFQARTSESDGKHLLNLIEGAVASHGLANLPEELAGPLRRFRELARSAESLASFLDALSLDRGIDHESLFGDRVALMSFHASKGLEWPVVFVTGCEDGLLPCTLFGARDDQEEKRLFYVGMTRARLRLFLSKALHRKISGRSVGMRPSPYLSFIPRELSAPLERGTFKGRKKTTAQLTLF